MIDCIVQIGVCDVAYCVLAVDQAMNSAVENLIDYIFSLYLLKIMKIHIDIMNSIERKEPF